MRTIYSQIYHFITIEEGLPAIQTYKESNLPIQVIIVISTYAYRSKSKYVVKNIYNELRKKRYYHKVLRLINNEKLKIKFIDDVNSPSFIESIPRNSLAICTGFSQIFKINLLNRFSLALNFHQSLLPYYKGPVPSYWCIKNREEWTGFTLHKMTDQIDSGQILFQKKVQVNHSDHLKLQNHIAEEIASQYQDLLKKILSNTLRSTNILDSKAIYLSHPEYLGFPKKP